MRKATLIFSLMLSAVILSADDLTVVVTDTPDGETIGAIDLSITGGIAPFEITWTGPDGFTASTEDISGLAAGTYVLDVTDSYCGAASLTVTVDSFSLPSGLNNLESAMQVRVAPNPFEQSIQLHIESVSGMDLQVRLMDVLGRSVLENQISIAAGVTDQSLKIERELSPGQYILELRDPQGLRLSRVLIRQED
jgi:hypothetical protein